MGKTFPSTIFRNKDHLSIGIKMDSHNNVHSFNVGQQKFIPLIGINELMLWFHKENFTFHHFLESKFVYQMWQARIHLIISFLFMIGCHKHILLFGINELMLLFRKKSFTLHKFLESKFICQLG